MIQNQTRTDFVFSNPSNLFSHKYLQILPVYHGNFRIFKCRQSILLRTVHGFPTLIQREEPHCFLQVWRKGHFSHFNIKFHENMWECNDKFVSAYFLTSIEVICRYSAEKQRSWNPWDSSYCTCPKRRSPGTYYRDQKKHRFSIRKKLICINWNLSG